MGRQLVFWKCKDNIVVNNYETYEKICDGKIVSGLESLDTDKILRRVSDVFSDWYKLDEYNFESSESSFTVETHEQAVIFECSWNMSYIYLNRIIDIMLEFDCPFYDPQINIRFDNKEM